MRGVGRFDKCRGDVRGVSEMCGVSGRCEGCGEI